MQKNKLLLRFNDDKLSEDIIPGNTANEFILNVVDVDSNEVIIEIPDYTPQVFATNSLSKDRVVVPLNAEYKSYNQLKVSIPAEAFTTLAEGLIWYIELYLTDKEDKTMILPNDTYLELHVRK